MTYILKEMIKIQRPIFFLCGPYYNSKNPKDRRYILQKAIREISDNNYIPLIIDDFIVEENIKDDNISVKLLEEIFAAISEKTYIFLDTISAASELGLFTNSAFKNHIGVFIPYETDIYNRNNIGYFVKEKILKDDKRISCVKYRPEIERKAIATDYVIEFYNFINNKIPKQIEDMVKSDIQFKTENKFTKIIVKKSEDNPQKWEQLNYSYDEKKKKVFVKVSVKMLFYIVASIAYEEYSDELCNKEKITFNIPEIIKSVENSIVDFISRDQGEDFQKTKEIIISTKLRYDITKVTYHMMTFIHLYQAYSSYRRIYLLTPSLHHIIEEKTEGVHPYAFFELNKEKQQVINSVKSDSFEMCIVNKNRKKREIYKYTETESGKKIRKVHKEIIEVIARKYKPHKNSFAYIKGKSIKNCVERHVESKFFIKYDIKNFFNSIIERKLNSFIKKEFNIEDSKELKEILRTCLYEDKLPLGLITSPILSDIYMKDFDSKISGFCERRGYVYTRYADDIMISARRKIKLEDVEIVERFVEKRLSMISLKLNKKKTKIIYLKERGNHIKYVGVNIVKGEKRNYITVGKRYINDIAKEYIAYIIKKIKGEQEVVYADNRGTFYEGYRIKGRVNFVRMIEGEEGIEKIKKRVETASHEQEKVNWSEMKLYPIATQEELN